MTLHQIHLFPKKEALLQNLQNFLRTSFVTLRPESVMEHLVSLHLQTSLPLVVVVEVLQLVPQTSYQSTVLAVYLPQTILVHWV